MVLAITSIHEFALSIPNLALMASSDSRSWSEAPIKGPNAQHEREVSYNL